MFDVQLRNLPSVYAQGDWAGAIHRLWCVLFQSTRRANTQTYPRAKHGTVRLYLRFKHHSQAVSRDCSPVFLEGNDPGVSGDGAYICLLATGSAGATKCHSELWIRQLGNKHTVYNAEWSNLTSTCQRALRINDDSRKEGIRSRITDLG